MSKMVLNPTKARTSNNYGINDITLDLDLPEEKDLQEFQNVSVVSDELDKLRFENIRETKAMSSKIGLNIKQNYGMKITVLKNTTIKNPIIIEFNLDEDNNTLVDNIKINFEKNSNAKFIIKYASDGNEKGFHYLKNEINMEENSVGKVIIANMINDSSDSFIAYENTLGGNAKLSSINIELGGDYKISNYYSKLVGDNSENDIKNIYLGTNNDIVDINYNIDELGKKTKCNIISNGAVDGSAKKHFKGIIDFKEGSTKSRGVENESCMLLSDKTESRSLPVLLCHEEDVYGEHGVSSGKPDAHKLFYLMTKGFSYDDARKLMVKASFNSIVREIDNEDLENQINKIIDEKI